MSINETTLPDFAIAALYDKNLSEDISGKVLAELPKIHKPKKAINPEALSTSNEITLQYLGKNLKQFVILVNYNNEVHLPDEQLTFLGTILAACKLNLADVAIINTNNQKISFDKIEQLGAKYIVLFGVDYPILNIHEAQLYQVQKLNELSVFTAQKLEMHNQNSPEAIQLKKHLWTALKQMMQLA